jgi:hypothetical protein
MQAADRSAYGQPWVAGPLHAKKRAPYGITPPSHSCSKPASNAEKGNQHTVCCAARACGCGVCVVVEEDEDG